MHVSIDILLNICLSDKMIENKVLLLQMLERLLALFK